MAASSEQKSPYIAEMACAGKGKDFPDWSHGNGLSVRPDGSGMAI